MRTLILLAASFAAATLAQTPPLDAASLERWVEGYGNAWERRDANAAMALFTPDASYRETPYAEPFLGREAIGRYWASVTEDQRNVHFEARVVAIDDDIGVVEWSATFTSVSTGATVGLDGVFVLEFEGGLCSELREWWFVRPGA